VVARLNNKTHETREKGKEAHAELLTACCGEAFNPDLDVWRLEFELTREEAKDFRLYEPSEEADPEAEMSAEELQHIGTLPRFSACMEELFLHLTRHWLRLADESEHANRSRWPMHPIWQQLRDAFSALASRRWTMKSIASSVAHSIADARVSCDGWRRGYSLIGD
jgi:hypothetical protein